VVPTQEELKGIKAQSAAIADLEIQLQNRKELEDSLKQNMDNAFESIITGAKNAKEAFADMAKGILADLAKVIARMIRMKIIEAGLNFLGMDTGGVTGVEAKTGRIMPAYAGGGYTSPLRNYSRGGMARGPQSGYNAVLHGNEAVVPLPDNRSIPVEFTGGGGGNQNNVTVNVSMNNDGTGQSNTQGDGNSAAQLGNAIARAVQAELQNQKRSGGLLSPYGAA
jgi:flagellar hook-basal body complex protein FliE